jgi:hypothetical protein
MFAVLMRVEYLAAHAHGTGPYPTVTRAELRAGLDLLPTQGPGGLSLWGLCPDRCGRPCGP